MAIAPIILRARCHLFQPNYKIIRVQFNVDEGPEGFPEYVMTNLLRTRGVPQDGSMYRIIIDPLFPH